MRSLCRDSQCKRSHSEAVHRQGTIGSDCEAVHRQGTIGGDRGEPRRPSLDSRLSLGAIEYRLEEKRMPVILFCVHPCADVGVARGNLILDAPCRHGKEKRLMLVKYSSQPASIRQGGMRSGRRRRRRKEEDEEEGAKTSSLSSWSFNRRGLDSYTNVSSLVAFQGRRQYDCERACASRKETVRSSRSSETTAPSLSSVRQKARSNMRRLTSPLDRSAPCARQTHRRAERRRGERE